MAIAFNTAADLGNNGGSTTSKTTAFTVGSGADRALIVVVWGTTSGNASNISGVTYAGVAMTLIDSINSTGGRWNYLFYLLNPASGSNDVVITSSTSDWIGGLAADYTGVAQSGQPDASNKASGGSNEESASVTTVADNCWTVCAGYANSGIAAGTGSTQRAKSAAFSNGILCDSNGAITPAGAYSMEITCPVSNSPSIVVASLSPAGAAATGSPWYYSLQQRAAV